MTILRNGRGEAGIRAQRHLRGRFIVAALALATALALLGGAPAEATFPGPNGRIAFTDFVGNKIFAVNPDGSGLEQLAHGSGKRNVNNPSWSPDGKRILFDAGPSDGSRIWIMRADGSHKRRLAGDADGVSDIQPQYTPNARRIVFSRFKPQKEVSAIWKMRANGTHKRALTAYHEGTCCDSNVFDFDPSVSPGGKRIAFTRYNARGVAAQVYVMDADGSHPHPVTPAPLEGAAPDWAPNDRWITFTSNARRTGSGIFKMRPDGSGIQRVSPDIYPHNDVLSTYSPRGDRIAFASDRNYPDACCLDLFAIDPDGGGEQMIDTDLSGAGIVDPAWGTAPLTP